jgi:hypothetical protein
MTPTFAAGEGGGFFWPYLPQADLALGGLALTFNRRWSPPGGRILQIAVVLMAPDRTEAIRGFFYIHLPHVATEEDTVEQA